jgi:hypothetical protein
MACNCGGGAKKAIHQVRRPDGTVKRYATEAEARAAADATNGEYQQLQR